MIAIMCAMREELDPILKEVNIKKEILHAKNIFYLAEFNSKELVLAYSKIGKVNAATTATILIEKFDSEIILFSGVAGGISEELKIGDLVIAEKSVQHDVDLTVFGYKHGYIPEGEIFYKCDEKLNKLAFNIAKKLNINLKSGIIATGDSFISSKEKKEIIKKRFNAIAIDMEGAAVNNVCWNFNRPFFMLRAISDTAEEAAGEDFDKFLEETSNISAKFLLEMLKEI